MASANKFKPHPEEHAGYARVRLEGWLQRMPSLVAILRDARSLRDQAPQDEG
jgi:hypothetical protein